jgi:hypothetical protein
VSRIPAKTVCDNCGRLYRGHEEGWHRLSWRGRPPTTPTNEGIQVWARGVDTPNSKDLCSWKCVGDYGAKQRIQESEVA